MLRGPEAAARARVDWGRVDAELRGVDHVFKTHLSRFDASPHVGRVLSSPDPTLELELVRDARVPKLAQCTG
jgi:hypothetical protein